MLLVAAVLVVGCGSDDDDSGSSTEASGGGSSQSLEAFEAKVDKTTKKATADDPSRPPTDGPKAVPNKSVFVIGCSFQAEGCARPTKAADEAAKAIGWQSTMIDTQGDPTKAANSIRQAISQKADGVIVNGFDGPALAAPLKAASDAGLKTVGMVAADPDGVYDVTLPGSLEPDGYVVAAQAYKASGGDLKMLLFTGDEFGVVQERVKGIERFIDECKAAGGDCEILDRQDMIAAQLGTQLPAQAAALARKNPDFTVVVTGYDGAGTFIIQGLEQSGVDLNDKQMIGFDANAPNIDIIRKGGFQTATVGLPLEWLGYAAVDDMNRLFAGEEPIELNVLHKLLTKDNVPATGAWEGDYPQFREAFQKAWGVN